MSTQHDPVPPENSDGFHLHKFHSYQGYAFPWYATLIWITFFICGTWYLIRNILLAP